MSTSIRRSVVASTCFFLFSLSLLGQSAGNFGSVYGTVTDPVGAVLPSALVKISNPVSGLERDVKTDASGRFQFVNLPLNPYHLTISFTGFSTYVQDVDVRSFVPISIMVGLKVGSTSTQVTVEANDLIEASSTFHTDIDRDLFNRVPLESASSSLSSLVTMSSPGVAADSNGLFHGMGDHASNSFSIDGQPITDQQSKVFSNQLPSNAVQSMTVIAGAPPAEFGGKTSLVMQVTTRSGQGITQPTGSVTASYGTFGTATGSIDLSYGGKNWGNFIEVDGLNSGRFLDPPQFTVFHAKGNLLNIFDRVDRQFSPADSLHLNLNYSRSWFQTPNAYDNLNIQNTINSDTIGDTTTLAVGNTDQRSKINTYNIAPTFTHIINANAVFNFGVYVRRDDYNYYPSNNPLADMGPSNLQNQTIAQNRTLTNAGAHTDISWVRGINNMKFGANYAQTFLRESDTLGIVANTFNSPCTDANGNPQNGFVDPSQCLAAGLVPNDGSINPNTTPFVPQLLPYDLTRGGGQYTFKGRTDVKELALYMQDEIRLRNWLFNVGIRGDLYNGLAIAREAQPRVGVAYTFSRTNTVLRASYARTLESPFNENLVLSSQGCLDPILNPLLACSNVTGPLVPGFRNEFHAGFQQGFGRRLVVSGEYVWKYTHNAFDFSVLGNTPVTFPIDWHNSKIPGFALRAEVPDIRGISGYVVMSSVSARFFPPQSAGAGATVGGSGLPFRIDHDERFNETAHLQYNVPIHQEGFFSKPWFAFNWRYDSGLVAGAVPCFNSDLNSGCGASYLPDGTPAIDVSGLTANQQFQAGLVCNGVAATSTSPLPNLCPAAQLTSTLVRIPAPSTENDDKNPPRIAPRNLFDMSIGVDNLFGTEKHRWSLRLTGINITNKYALYNFLSTFSGTHYVTPRALTAEIGFHF